MGIAGRTCIITIPFLSLCDQATLSGLVGRAGVGEAAVRADQIAEQASPYLLPLMIHLYPCPCSYLDPSERFFDFGEA